MPIPEPFVPEYRIATAGAIRSWSFGRLMKTRVPNSASLEDHVGTLNDQRIFGPVVDHRCVCGKYEGMKFDGMICDRCGVKITAAEARRRRFGHIDFATGPVQHPFDPSAKMVCFPVIPAAFWESRSGVELCLIYERLMTDPTALIRLVEYLTPIAADSMRWNMKDSFIFTRGIGLTRETPT